MKITKPRLDALVLELIDENPFACRAVLQVLDITLCEDVPTAAVSCGDHPCLMVNPRFVAQHCRTDEHLKALLCHEFLHVLLRHTEGRGPRSDAQHLAFDAVINGIIHRALGPAYSDLMSRYYHDEQGVTRLLRPPRDAETRHMPSRSTRRSIETTMTAAWLGLYRNATVVADDIEAIARDLGTGRRLVPRAGWLGSHDGHADGEDADAPLEGVVLVAVERALASMNGSGIWRAPRAHGIAAAAYSARMQASDVALGQWRTALLAVLRRHLVPDPRARSRQEGAALSGLPVLSPSDRRAFSRALWSPLFPEALWPVRAPVERASAQVYLDVSGSMNHEMPHVVAVLARLGSHIRRPFWAFSNVIAPAVIEDGQLRADTTGGTSLGCVLRHLHETRPRAAVVVTDGYVENVSARDMQRIQATRLHAIVTREGSPAALARAGIPYTQLGALPA